jgi:hypothetical protein
MFVRATHEHQISGFFLWEASACKTRQIRLWYNLFCICNVRTLAIEPTESRSGDLNRSKKSFSLSPVFFTTSAPRFWQRTCAVAFFVFQCAGTADGQKSKNKDFQEVLWLLSLV